MYVAIYILTTNTVSVFPAKFIKYSLLLAYFSYLLIVGNSLLTSLFTTLRIICKFFAHNSTIPTAYYTLPPSCSNMCSCRHWLTCFLTANVNVFVLHSNESLKSDCFCNVNISQTADYAFITRATQLETKQSMAQTTRARVPIGSGY